MSTETGYKKILKGIYFHNVFILYEDQRKHVSDFF